MSLSAYPLLSRVLMAVVLVFALVGLQSAPADATASMAMDFFNLINAEREARGLAPVRAHAGLVDPSDGWSHHMADAGRLEHSQLFFLNDATWASENVGYTTNSDAGELHGGFMASQPHRSNILDPRATFVGIGVVEGHGRFWITQEYSNASY